MNRPSHIVKYVLTRLPASLKSHQNLTVQHCRYNQRRDRGPRLTLKSLIAATPVRTLIILILGNTRLNVLLLTKILQTMGRSITRPNVLCITMTTCFLMRCLLFETGKIPKAMISACIAELRPGTGQKTFKQTNLLSLKMISVRMPQHK
jgi:hypothetical protein